MNVVHTGLRRDRLLALRRARTAHRARELREPVRVLGPLHELVEVVRVERDAERRRGLRLGRLDRRDEPFSQVRHAAEHFLGAGLIDVVSEGRLRGREGRTQSRRMRRRRWSRRTSSPGCPSRGAGCQQHMSNNGARVYPRSPQLLERLARVERAAEPVVREHVRSDLLQHVVRREQAENMDCE